MDRTSIEFIQRASDIESKLSLFTGTQDYHQHPFGIIYTDGIAWLAEEAQAFWLIDAIASWQPEAQKHIGFEFQLWSLCVAPDYSCALECRADTGAKAEVRQEIPYTDFPLNSITLYCENGVLLLPSEH